MQFEGVHVFSLKLKQFQLGAALTIPGFGIFVGSNHVNDINLLRHEYGHILQYRKYGFFYFWFKIAFVSLKSAYNTNHKKGNSHMTTWTEWSANSLSYNYFEHPANWDFKNFPIGPTVDIV